MSLPMDPVPLRQAPNGAVFALPTDFAGLFTITRTALASLPTPTATSRMVVSAFPPSVTAPTFTSSLISPSPISTPLTRSILTLQPSATSSALAVPSVMTTGTGSYTGYQGPAMFPQGVLLLILSLIAMVLCIPPLVWHAKSKNTAAAALIAYLITLNLINVINVCVWPNDDISHQFKGYGLCDVETKIEVGLLVAIPGCIAAIFRDLAMVMDTKHITLVPSTKQKRINMLSTGVLVFGFPVLEMALHYINQPSRFFVFALTGCAAGLDNSWLGLVLQTMWPLIISVIAAIFGILLCFRMHIYKTEFGRLIAISGTTKSRFLRLFIMSTLLILIYLPLQVYIFLRNVEYGVTSFSWSLTHGPYWNYISIIPSFGQVIFDRWLRIVSGILIFCFFGLGDDALRMYRGWLCMVGMNKIFPNLEKEYVSNKWSFGLGTWNTLNGKAKSLLKRRAKTDATTTATESTARTSVNHTVATPTTATTATFSEKPTSPMKEDTFKEPSSKKDEEA